MAIPDGVSIVVKNQDKTEDGFEYVYVKGDERIEINLDNPGEELITLNPKDTIITDKISFINEIYLYLSLVFTS